MNQFDAFLGDEVSVPGQDRDHSTGVFCVVCIGDTYFRSFSHTMYPRVTSNFSEAAKYFIGHDCTRADVERTAEVVGGHVVFYNYGRVSERVPSEYVGNAVCASPRVSKINLDGQELTRATFCKSSWEQVEPSYVVCSACGRKTFTTEPLKVCPHCSRKLVYDE